MLTWIYLYASSEEETEVGEERIQPGPLRVQLHVNVDKLGEVREAGTDGDGLSSQKIMFDTVDEEFEGIMDDEKVWDSIPREARGEAWTRRVYHFNDEHDAKLFYERVEEKLRQINIEVRDDQEIKGRVSWASADNNRGDSFISAMCLCETAIPRAYNSKQEETSTDKVEWAAVTLEQIFQDQLTKDRLKGKVKAVYVMENWFMRDMTPEEKIKKGDEDILILSDARNARGRGSNGKRHNPIQ